jgi:hypothetical protein
MKVLRGFLLFLIYQSFFLSFLKSQELLEINTAHKCIFSGNIMDEELYRYPTNEDVKSRVKDILLKGGAEQNFELVQTNVENVTAVISNGKRYILYSLDFIQKATNIEVNCALAHEIGHHVNNHNLIEAYRKNEELAADKFMGYALGKMAFREGEIINCIRNIKTLHNDANFEERRFAINEGYDKAIKSLQMNGALPFDNAVNNESRELTLPSFPWPPPQCNSQFELNSSLFSDATVLHDIDKNIRRSLNNKGYSQHAYFSVPNGFAIVTQLEQYNGSDGTSRSDKTRWFDYPTREEFSGVVDYIKSFFFPNKGYFRLFVFIATNQPFNSTNKRVTKTEASAWLSQGFNKLPNNIANMPFTEGYAVTCLVYEFEVPESNRKPNQICPSPRFNAKTHLARAGIISN